MTSYIAHFSLGFGVAFQIEMTVETKHFSTENLDSACNDLAEKLGASFLYYEEK